MERLSNLESLLVSQSCRQNLLSTLITLELQKLISLKQKLDDIFDLQKRVKAALESEGEGLERTKKLETDAKKETVQSKDLVLITLLKIISNKGWYFSDLWKRATIS